LAAVTVLTACREATTAVYRPGDVVVYLTTPYADDGAVLIRLIGLPSGAVEVTADNRGLVVYSMRVADTLRIAVFGTLTAGPLLHVGPIDRRAVSLIDARVEDAVSRGNEQREPLSGYAVELLGRE
jgi:hypothetical protein